MDDNTPDSSAAIDALLSDTEARGSWQRYHLVRDVLQNDYTPALPLNFADMVREEVAAEAPLTNVVSIQSAVSRPAATKAGGRIGFLKPAAGLAVAASLIGGTFLSTQLGDTALPVQQPPSVVERPDRTVASSVTLVADSSPTPGTRWQLEVDSSDNAERVARLNSLLINHMEVASMGKVQGMVLHSRVVGYDGIAGAGESN